MAEWMVQETGKAFLERNRSKFYGYCITAQDVPTFQRALTHTKQLHPDASHTIFAYRIREKGKAVTEKCTDGGEPSHTAGLPTLGLLRHHNLVNSALITIRIYGGVKLGKNNLLRTYLEIAQSALKNATVVLLENSFIIQASLNGHQYSLIMDQLKNHPLLKYQFEFRDNAYYFTFSLKESECQEWRLFFHQYQIYSYAIIEQK
ncbi:YigZ family protein [bacterium]|nr:YigZ family protein [bacterium]